MNELIKITTNEQGSGVVSARDLHEFLEVKSKFADWIKNRIAKYDFSEGVDYTELEGFSKNLEKGGRPEFDYALTLDMAKELSMVERNEKGKQARQYFIECEKKLAAKQYIEPAVQLSRKELALLVIQAEEEKEQLQKQLHLQAPKVEYANEVLDTTDCVVTTVIANEMGYSAVKFNKLLKEKGVQWKVDGIWVLTSRYLNKGYAQMRTHTFTDPATKLIRATQYMVWTQRGRAFLWWLLKKQVVSDTLQLH